MLRRRLIVLHKQLTVKLLQLVTVKVSLGALRQYVK